MNESIFFWLAPSVLAIFSFVFVFVAVYERRVRSARWAAAGYAVGFVSLLCDTLRAPSDLVLMSAATALHWTALTLISAAFVVRKGERLSLSFLAAVALIGGGFLVYTGFINRLPALGTANANFIGAAVQAAALPALYRHRASAFDGLLLGTVCLAVVCYLLRGILFLPQDAGLIDAEAGFWSLYNLTFYLTTGPLALLAGVVLLLAIGGDLIERHSVASHTDHLTGIANRRSLERWIDDARDGRASFSAVVVVDLDHFKSINDRHGHEAGDRALAAAAASLKDALGNRGRLARIGGEEFAVLVHESCDQDGADIAEELCAALRVLEIESVPEGLSGSFGVAVVDGGHTRAALRRADQAVYAAKDAGRDCVIAATAPPPRREALRRAAFR